MLSAPMNSPISGTDNRSARRSSHDRVVYKDHTTPLDHFRQHIELEGDPGLTQPLIGLNERSSDVAILDQGLGIREVELPRIADGGRRGRVRQTNHNVCIGGSFSCKLLSHPLPDQMEPLTTNQAVG